MANQTAHLKRMLEFGGCNPENVYVISGDVTDCLPYIRFRFRQQQDQETGKEPVYMRGRLDTGSKDGLVLPRELFDEMEAARLVRKVNHQLCRKYGDDPVPLGISDLLVPATNLEGDRVEVPVNMVTVRGVDGKYIRNEPAVGIGFIQALMGMPFSIDWEENIFEIALIPKQPESPPKGSEA